MMTKQEEKKPETKMQKREDPFTAIESFILSKKKRLGKYASRKYDGDDFIRSVLICIESDENLQKCIASPKSQISLFNALKQAAGTGLSLNPLDGQACLVAYKENVSYQVEKEGLIILAFDTGKVEKIGCDVLKEGDAWEIEKNINNETYTHNPARRDRGSTDGYYAYMTLKDGTSKVEYMTEEEVEEHALKYSGQYAAYVADPSGKKVPVWIKSRTGMGLKTVIKSLLRKNKINTAIAEAIAADDNSEATIIDITPDNTKQTQKDIM